MVRRERVEHTVSFFLLDFSLFSEFFLLKRNLTKKDQSSGSIAKRSEKTHRATQSTQSVDNWSTRNLNMDLFFSHWTNYCNLKYLHKKTRLITPLHLTTANEISIHWWSLLGELFSSWPPDSFCLAAQALSIRARWAWFEFTPQWLYLIRITCATRFKRCSEFCCTVVSSKFSELKEIRLVSNKQQQQQKRKINYFNSINCVF